MNTAKCSAGDYINFIIVTPRVVTAIKAERIQPISRNARARYAFTRHLTRPEPGPETLRSQSRPQVDPGGILIYRTQLLRSLFRKVPWLDYSRLCLARVFADRK